MKHLKIENNKQEPSVAMEGESLSTGEKIFYSVAYGLIGLAWIWAKWFDYKQKKDQESAGERELEKQTGILLSAISKTYTNKAWLDKQTFVTGMVAGSDISKVLAIDKKMPEDIVVALNKALSTIGQVGQEMAQKYRQWQLEVNRVAKPLYDKAVSLGEPGDRSRELYDLWMKVDGDLKKIKHPLSGENWAKLPGGKVLPGGLVFEPSPQGNVESHKVKSAKIPSNSEVPALTKDQVMALGTFITLLLKKQLNKEGTFAEALGQLYWAPCPQDTDPAQTWKSNDGLGDFFEGAFADHHKGDKRDFYDSEIWAIGALTDQGFDPLWTLEECYDELLLDTAKAVNTWIKRSIKH